MKLVTVAAALLGVVLSQSASGQGASRPSGPDISRGLSAHLRLQPKRKPELSVKSLGTDKAGAKATLFRTASPSPRSSTPLPAVAPRARKDKPAK